MADHEGRHAATEAEASAWFNQPAFDPAYLVAHGIQGNTQWCVRHWAPCPVLGGNGIRATFMLIQTAVEHEFSMRTPLCCQIGDVGMFEIWGKCPPSRLEES